MQKTILRLFILFSFLCLAETSYAVILTFPVLDPSQTDAVFRNLAADVAFRSVRPASSATAFGFSLGITGTETSTSQSSSIFQNAPSTIPAGDINAALEIPLGLSLEIGYFPTLSINGSNFGRFGGDLKWTFSNLFGALPFDAAIRVTSSSGNISYTQNLGSGTTNINYQTNIWGTNLNISKTLATILTPYIGYGLIQHNSNLSATGTSSLFNGNFPPGATSTSEVGTSGWFDLGAQLKLGFVTMAVEYANLFSVDSFSARIGVQF